ncbi:hypothetical protein [Caudoviricetes sp.]|nr:hypothetical protein [Caudoviricetes sp.]
MTEIHRSNRYSVMLLFGEEDGFRALNLAKDGALQCFMANEDVV